MIRLDNIDVTFFAGTPLARKALNGLSLNLNDGDFATVIGSNGAGKSTLLNIITGNIYPDNGAIILNGVDITRTKPSYRSKHIARVFQDPLDGTCADLTIYENMALAYNRGNNWGLKSALNSQVKKKLCDAVSVLGMGIENRMDHPMGMLSGGQRQAVSLIMATLAPLDILILDEHTAALDPKAAAMIIDHTSRLVLEKKLTTLMVTHSMHQAVEVGNRILVLHKGSIIHDFDAQQKASLSPTDMLTLFEEMDS
jgi:putative ABC transport system ATP-binding protein